MAGLNKVTIIGNLGRDPEVKMTDAGLCICRFSVAVTEKLKDKEQTEWFDVTVFGKLAEIAGEYLKKGRQVYVEGRLETRKFEDKNGQERSKTSVVAKELIFLGKHGGGDNDHDETPAPARKPGQQTLSSLSKGVEYIGWNDTADIPF